MKIGGNKLRLTLFTILALFLGLQISLFAVAPAVAADPSGWFPQYTATGKSLISISAGDAKTCWAAGYDNTTNAPVVIMTADGGTTWVDRTPAVTTGITDISAVGASTAWAIGGKDSGGSTVPCVLRTTDKGLNWSTPLSLSNYALIRISAVDANICWVAAGTQGEGSPVHRVFRTTNGGTNWQEVDPGVPYTTMTCISAVDANTCWVGSTGLVDITNDVYEGTLRKTSNGGTTWTSQGPNGYSYFALSAVNSKVVWCIAYGTGKSLLQSACMRSLDGGATWTYSTVPYLFLLFIVEGLDAVSASTAWLASINTPPLMGAIYKNTNGDTWNLQTDFPPSGSVNRYTWGLTAADYKTAWVVCAETVDSATTGSIIYHTTNGGWTQAVPQVTSITPASGNPNTTVNVTSLAGSNFASGATVWLERSGTIIKGSNVVVSPTNITCTFSLSGAPSGTYDVVVRNPDGADGRKVGGFTVNSPNPCGLGGGLSLVLFGAIMGLLSLAGSKDLLRRRRRKAN